MIRSICMFNYSYMNFLIKTCHTLICSSNVNIYTYLSFRYYIVTQPIHVMVKTFVLNHYMHNLLGNHSYLRITTPVYWPIHIMVKTFFLNHYVHNLLGNHSYLRINTPVYCVRQICVYICWWVISKAPVRSKNFRTNIGRVGPVDCVYHVQCPCRAEVFREWYCLIKLVHNSRGTLAKV